jgi:hypothetical protein
MPKLDGGYAAETEEQEGGDFQVLKPGKYVYRLTEVEEGETGPNSKEPGTPKWVWKLAVDKDYHPELRKGRHQTTLQEHIPLTKNMQWKMKALFNGFGYTADSDTDEIIEDETARIVVYVKTGKDIQTGDPRTQSQRFVQFDASKWERFPEDDEDDNQ